MRLGGDSIINNPIPKQSVNLPHLFGEWRYCEADVLEAMYMLTTNTRVV